MAAAAPANMKEMATKNDISARRITGSSHWNHAGRGRRARPYWQTREKQAATSGHRLITTAKPLKLNGTARGQKVSAQPVHRLPWSSAKAGGTVPAIAG